MADFQFGGSIEIIFGPMFSGKSTELLRMVKRYTYAQKKCLVINYAKDTRYSNEDVVSTHDRQMMKAMKCLKVSEALSVFKKYDVIAIDEGQFFPDIVEQAEYFANKGKIVIVAALDATFQRKPFDVVGLLPIAERVTKLSAVCAVCAVDAAFTQRLIENSEVELIGGNELYRPVCRKCFMASKSMLEMATTLTGATSSEKESDDKLSSNESDGEMSILDPKRKSISEDSKSVEENDENIKEELVKVY